jgi:hypothetical protein
MGVLDAVGGQNFTAAQAQEYGELEEELEGLQAE